MSRSPDADDARPSLSAESLQSPLQTAPMPQHKRGVTAMADIIAIGYPDERTAAMAADEARKLAADLIIEPDAIAVIVCDKDGKFKVTTNHHAVGGGATYGMFWG